MCMDELRNSKNKNGNSTRNSRRINDDADNGYWQLRTRAYSDRESITVNYDGSINYAGRSYGAGVRPALWLDIGE